MNSWLLSLHKASQAKSSDAGWRNGRRNILKRNPLRQLRTIPHPHHLHRHSTILVTLAHPSTRHRTPVRNAAIRMANIVSVLHPLVPHGPMVPPLDTLRFVRETTPDPKAALYLPEPGISQTHTDLPRLVTHTTRL